MNNTLKNGFRVLEYLANTAKDHSIKELAEIFQLPNSHICRLLKTLAETGYVEQDAKSRQYRISYRVLTLSNACLKRMELRKRVRPYAQKLAVEMKGQVFVAVPHEHHALIVDVLYPDCVHHDSGITIGNVNEAHVSATGKVCAAYAKDVDAAVESLDLIKLTDKTITDRGVFKDELERIRAEKVAVTDSERGEGVKAVASPVFNCEGEFVAAMGMQLPQVDISTETWNLFKEKIKATAEGASFALGYSVHNLV